ncbi:MAG: hypothetical protein NTX44_00090 [Ignavibacteriales bacterium]|nr:hypothetical protein [Ignavibacteriales bacterium]
MDSVSKHVQYRDGLLPYQISRRSYLSYDFANGLGYENNCHKLNIRGAQADQMSVSTLSIAGGRYRNTLRVLQLWGSACYQQFENYHLRAVVPTARRQGAAVRSCSAGSRSCSIAMAMERT